METQDLHVVGGHVPGDLLKSTGEGILCELVPGHLRGNVPEVGGEAGEEETELGC